MVGQPAVRRVSYRANAQGKADELITAHLLYRRPARQEDERLAAYQALFKEAVDRQALDNLRDCTNKGWALGTGRFLAKIARLAERRTTPLPKGRPSKNRDV
jgi:putative transposase